MLKELGRLANIFEANFEIRDIERKSMAIIEKELPWVNTLPPGVREITMRVIHTTGDLEIGSSLKFSPGAVESGLAAIKQGNKILTDVSMVLAGLIKGRMEKFGVQASCHISSADVVEEASRLGFTRAMVAMERYAPGANGGIVAIGNAPTALFTLCRMIKEGTASPALVVGTPVGFVGAAESKVLLTQTGVPYITLAGTRGGSTIAAAIVNAMLLLA